MVAASSARDRAAARNIVRNYLCIRPGENVVIETWSHTLPFASLLVDEARKVGARTLVHFEDETSFWSAVDRKQSKLLGSSSDPEWAALAKTDAYIFIWGPEDRPRIDRYSDAMWREATSYNDHWYEVAHKSHVRGCRLELGRATPLVARAYGLDAGAWQRELTRACLVDPRKMKNEADRVARRLAGGKRLTIHHANGTDLELGLKAIRPRTFVGLHTKESLASRFGMLVNLPTGAVGVALDEKVGEGTVVANRPTYLEGGRVEGARWRFEGGKLVTARFSNGQATFAKAQKNGKPGKDRPGFLYLGLNPEIRRAPNMEESERGAALVGVGRNTFLGGTNTSNFMGWAVVSGSEVAVDGTPIVRRGKVL